jgi:serine/threonine-protein kinase
LADDDLTGNLIGDRYELLRLLGRGGMGTVYEARNNATFKRCALKILQAAELAGKSELVERFLREARASSIIESQHIIQIYDSGLDRRGWPFMVMEFLQGEDLEHLARRTGPMAPLGVAKIALQAASGLAKAHAAGIVHRDIKPANLYVTQKEDGSLIVKLLDFGIAKVKMDAFHEVSTGLTRTGSLLGTPLYMSPEQVRRASQIDGRSDVWSLGVVMFELLSGELPWAEQGSLGELMASILTAELPLLQDRAPWVPPELAEVVHRAMSRDLARRYADAAELRDALYGILRDGAHLLPETLAPVSSEQRAFMAPRLEVTHDGLLRATARTGLTATPRPRPKASLSVTVVASLVGLIVLVGVGVVLLSRDGAEAARPLPAAPLVEVKNPGPGFVTFDLAVRPVEVKASVDGQAAEVVEGKLAIRGEVGSTHVVRITLGERSHEQVVAVAASGLVPSALDLDALSPPPRSPTAEPAKVSTKQGASRRPAPAAAPTRSSSGPAPRRAPNLAEGTDEF